MADGIRLRLAIVATPAAIVAVAVAAHGCGDARKIDEPRPRATGELNLEIQSIRLPSGPADGPRVTFRATDANGVAIDVLAEMANAAARKPPYLSNPRFTLAQVEADGSTTSWYEATVEPKAFTAPAGVTPAPTAAVQPGAQSAPAGNPAERLVANGDGSYTFAFGAPTTPPERRDAAKPLTVGMWGERVAPRSNGGVKRWPAAATRTFLQGAATSGPPHEAVSDAACNTCHVVMRAHDRRETVALCKTCHSGSTAAPYRDPESNEDLDLRTMIHRIHAGGLLPSVRSGGSFYIVGFNQNVFDFSHGRFPPLREATDCTACHQGGANADAWKTRASLKGCISCHDGVRFDGSAGTACALGTNEAAPCDHPLSPDTVTASSTCASCHAAGTASPPIGPDVAHAGRNELLELARAWRYEILSATVNAERKAVVRFRVTRDGIPSDIKSDPAWLQGGGASRLFVDVAWPAGEITNEGSGYVDATVKSTQFPAGTPGQGLPVQINALTAATAVPGETNVFELTSPTPIPPQFSSARVVLEGHPAEGTVRIPVPNAVQDVAVSGGAAPARRAVVSAETCNACHGSISAHGANRNETPASCVACHTPRATDFVRRVQADPTAPPEAEAPIDFKVLVHQIHAADIRRTKVTVLGFGGTPHEFPAAYPGQTGRCTICHVGDSYQLAPEASDTTVKVGDPTIHDLAADPAEQRVGKTQAVCASCHDMVRFDAAPDLPACNTLVPVNSAACRHSGGPQSGEATCASCHGKGAAFDLEKVHPISTKPQ